MARVLENLDPQKVFYYFEEISRIPRGSGNEKAVSDYMVKFAEDLGLWVKQDEANNIYIKKPATKGYENAPTVIMQGHLDMVCEKNNDTQHDFETQGLDLYIDGDFIRARGTTLGADNGVAIAYQMAVLADDTIEHPAIEALMTTEEETGMGGVAAMHPEYLEGKMLINLDTDNEGEFLVSCAGGAKALIELPVSYEKMAEGTVLYNLKINQLLGGHSGADIHRERANANVLMNRVLDAVRMVMPLQLAVLSGGTKDNVITREAVATVAIPQNQCEAFETIIANHQGMFTSEYEAQDPDVKLVAMKVDSTVEVLSQELSEKILDMIMIMPHGIMGQSMQIEGLVETSLNIGVVQLEKEILKMVVSIRSSMPTKKENIKRKIDTVCKYIGAKCVLTGDYPAWVYASESPLRDKAVEVFEQMYGKKPEIKAIHAGLECGFILEKMPGVDMIAFGPNTYDIHSPEERASISSMERVYGYLIALLKNMKNL
ncbi:MAG: aminoacyl-histidine dipeptidase [Cellulosilyticaceae bacterium]